MTDPETATPHPQPAASTTTQATTPQSAKQSLARAPVKARGQPAETATN